MGSHKIFLDKATNPGIKRGRKPNQDYVDFREPKDQTQLLESGHIFIVADGVGGASEGHRASEFAAREVMSRYYKSSGKTPGERLRRVVRQVGDRLHQLANSRGKRMATTLVAAVVIGDKLTIANVGDSRAYLLHRGTLEQITRDHNIAGELARDNHLTEDQALRSKMKNRLTRSVGGERDVHVDVFERKLATSDRVFLCTDGLTRYATTQKIQELASQGDGSRIVDSAIAFANKPVHTFKGGRKARGGADNVTALVFEIGPESTELQVSPFKPQGDDDVEATLVFENDSRGKPRVAKQKRKLGSGIWISAAGIFVIIALIIIAPSIGDRNATLNRWQTMQAGQAEPSETSIGEAVLGIGPGASEEMPTEEVTADSSEANLITPDVLTPSVGPTEEAAGRSFCMHEIEVYLEPALRGYPAEFQWSETRSYQIYYASTDEETTIYTLDWATEVGDPSPDVHPHDWVLIIGGVPGNETYPAGEEECMAGGGIWVPEENIN